MPASSANRILAIAHAEPGDRARDIEPTLRLLSAAHDLWSALVITGRSIGMTDAAPDAVCRRVAGGLGKVADPGVDLDISAGPKLDRTAAR